MDEGKLPENHLTSAAAFVEGGVQDACHDACSICLEDFSDSEPSTLTTCNHEFHLQCILEWCQRSSQCPMCWQSISLKDPSSQELLDAVEHERNVRMNPPRNTTVFHHPALGDIELQHLPVGATESELEERIIQHLAAAAAMGRARHIARREGRNRSSGQSRPHYLVFSTQPDGTSVGLRDGNGQPSALVIGDSNTPYITIGGDTTHLMGRRSLPQADQHIAASAGSSGGANPHGTPSTNRSGSQTSPSSQDQAGPSDFQSFADTMKSRLNSLSTRYKESITKSTRGWKERLFARNSPASNHTDEVHREVDQVTPTVTRMMDHLGITEDAGTTVPAASSDSMNSSTRDPIEPQTIEPVRFSLDEAGPRSPHATSTVSH